MGKHQTFRANVGIVVVDDVGAVLALERRHQPDAWQLPQGGLHVGEEPMEAALRELTEETGLGADQVGLLAEHPGWLAYELPADARSKKTGRGQVQKWFLFRLTDPKATIDPAQDPASEFVRSRWISLSELAEQTWEVRRPIYRAVAATFQQHLS